ncbi:MAG TPA: GYD domain-containing protein [Bacteroidota bacterium]|jgi:uncharacterized protein with GYD domain|nr:GYD domain-containing protein [Bacteroidota bacterium]
MGKFLIKASYTADGTKGLLKEGGSKRKKAVEKMVAGHGGKVEAFYYAFGEYDVFAIIELPDTVTAAALALAINASGMVTNTMTVLMTPADVDKATKKTVNYRAPGR